MQLIINDQLPDLTNHLGALQRRLGGDLTPLMQGVGALLESSTRQRFQSKKAPSGVAWEQLKPSTIKQKTQASGKHRGILVEQGDLKKSITHHAASQSVAVGTNREYAKYHQLGTKHMPARPFLGLSDTDRVDIRELINDFLSGAING